MRSVGAGLQVPMIGSNRRLVPAIGFLAAAIVFATVAGLWTFRYDASPADGSTSRFTSPAG